MNKFDKTEFSKYMAYLLRHHPENIGMKLMDFGWLDTDKFIESINKSEENNYEVTLDQIKDIVATDKKQRYSFKAEDSNPYKYIRANQGHSIPGLVMDYTEITPETGLPEHLYHGTSLKNFESIMKDGKIKAMERNMVHLSGDVETAKTVGKRHKNGQTIILVLDSLRAYNNGIKFFISTNKVYLVNELSTQYVDTIIVAD